MSRKESIILNQLQSSELGRKMNEDIEKLKKNRNIHDMENEVLNFFNIQDQIIKENYHKSLFNVLNNLSKIDYIKIDEENPKKGLYIKSIPIISRPSPSKRKLTITIDGGDDSKQETLFIGVLNSVKIETSDPYLIIQENEKTMLTIIDSKEKEFVSKKNRTIVIGKTNYMKITTISTENHIVSFLASKKFTIENDNYDKSFAIYNNKNNVNEIINEIPIIVEVIHNIQIETPPNHVEPVILEKTGDEMWKYVEEQEEKNKKTKDIQAKLNLFNDAFKSTINNLSNNDLDNEARKTVEHLQIIQEIDKITEKKTTLKIVNPPEKKCTHVDPYSKDHTFHIASKSNYNPFPDSIYKIQNKETTEKRIEIGREEGFTPHEELCDQIINQYDNSNIMFDLVSKSKRISIDTITYQDQVNYTFSIDNNILIQRKKNNKIFLTTETELIAYFDIDDDYPKIKSAYEFRQGVNFQNDDELNKVYGTIEKYKQPIIKINPSKLNELTNKLNDQEQKYEKTLLDINALRDQLYNNIHLIDETRTRLNELIEKDNYNTTQLLTMSDKINQLELREQQQQQQYQPKYSYQPPVYNIPNIVTYQNQSPIKLMPPPKLNIQTSTSLPPEKTKKRGRPPKQRDEDIFNQPRNTKNKLNSSDINHFNIRKF